jgi:hypothetical protein
VTFLSLVDFVSTTTFLFFVVFTVWHQPVSFPNTSAPNGVSPSFRSPQALRAFVPLEQSPMQSLVSSPSWVGRPWHGPGCVAAIAPSFL